MKNSSKFRLMGTHGDLAWLILRVWLGLSLFVQHGIEKIFRFSEMKAHFPDPLHIGKTPSLLFALLSDAVCSIFVAAGIFTRIASAVVVINLLVVFIYLHEFSFHQEHGQLVYVYLGGYLAILISGGGKYGLGKSK